MFYRFVEYCHDNGEITQNRRRNGNGEVWTGNLRAWYNQNGVSVNEVMERSEYVDNEIRNWRRNNLTTDVSIFNNDDNFAEKQNVKNVACFLGLLKVHVNVSFGDKADVRAFFHIINFYFYF